MNALEALAALAIREGHYRRAGLLAGASARLRTDTGVTLEPLDQSLHDQTIHAMQAALTAEAADGAYQEGWRMSTKLALQHALSESHETATSHTSTRSSATAASCSAATRTSRRAPSE